MGLYSENNHVFAYSRRYAWPNEKVFDESADYSARIHADDLYNLIQKLGLKKVSLIGHSYGAFTALLMALDHPEIVNLMVLGEPPATPLLKAGTDGRASFERFIQNNIKRAGEAFRTD